MIEKSYVEIEGLGPTVSGNRAGGGLLLSLAELPDFLFQQLLRSLLHGLCEEAGAMGHSCSIFLGAKMMLELKGKATQSSTQQRGERQEPWHLQLRLDDDQKAWILKQGLEGAGMQGNVKPGDTGTGNTINQYAPEDDTVLAMLQQSSDAFTEANPNVPPMDNLASQDKTTLGSRSDKVCSYA